MSMIWCLIWGTLTFIVMTVTIKYYLPRLSIRVHKETSEARTIVSEQNKKLMIFILIGCTLFSTLCGYVAFLHSTSTMGLFKMTLAFSVLSCVFITDLEFMLIPNLCSIILLSGRILTIIVEFIWMKEFAVQWLINSVIAMVISVVLLLIMFHVTRGGLGLGDVKLFGGIGFLCGIRAVCFTLVLAFFLCAITSTVLILTKKKQLKDSLPLGPFIWAGYGISVLLSII